MADVRLDIGCGDEPRGNLNVDVRRTNSVDVVADVHHLPFGEAIASEVLLVDVIEHFRYSEIEDVLVEIRSVLEPGGELWVRTPDFRWILDNVDNIDFMRLQRKLYGGWTYPLDEADDYPENRHGCIFTPGKLREVLERAGFQEVQVNTRLPAPNHWNMAAHCVKPENSG